MKFQLESIGTVRAERARAQDDFWGGTQVYIMLEDAFDSSAFSGLQEFSHVEVLFLFDQVDSAKIVTGARHPRNNREWPAVGIFAQRGKSRPNRIGSTICRLLSVDGTRLHVGELDAIDGTPILDIKPVMNEFLPRETITQPAWSHELMRDYWRIRD